MARNAGDEEDGFLSRWARRKRAVRETETQPAPAPEPVEPHAADPDDPNRPLTPEEVEALPDPDTLEPGADFKRFLREGVPEELKRRALRRLWRSNPVFGVLDGLNDYDLDYTDAATVVANLKTAFKVGKGIVLPEDEDAEKKKAAEGDAADAPGEAASDEAEAGKSETASAATDQPGSRAADRTAAVDVEGAPARLPRLTPFAPDPAQASAERAPAENAERTRGRAVQRRWGGFAGHPAPPTDGGSGSDTGSSDG